RLEAVLERAGNLMLGIFLGIRVAHHQPAQALAKILEAPGAADAHDRDEHAALAVVLEGKREPRAELHHLAVFDLHVELLDLGDTQVAQRAGRGANSVACRVLPGVRAGADHFGDAINGTAAFLRHGSLSSWSRANPAEPFYTGGLRVAMQPPIAGAKGSFSPDVDGTIAE